MLRGLPGPGWAMVALCMVCCIVGCTAGESASLRGKVSYGGQPVQEGAIRLNPKGETPGPGGSAKIVDGSYEIPDLLAGTYSVMITGTRPATPAEIARMEREEAAEKDPEEEREDEEGAPRPPSERRVPYIPGKYNISTTLEVVVSPGENTKDFTLER